MTELRVGGALSGAPSPLLCVEEKVARSENISSLMDSSKWPRGLIRSLK